MSVPLNELILLILSSFVLSFVLVPITINIAKHVNAISVPKDRHIHKKSTPLLGGLAIFLSYMVILVISVSYSNFEFLIVGRQLPIILAASVLLLLVGIIDDINPIKPRHKLIVQIIVAILIVYVGDIRIDQFLSFLPTKLDAELTRILSVFWIVSVVNAINIVDGLNGLSSGVSIIYFATILVVSLYTGVGGTFVITLCALMIGSISGYLPWNFPKSKVFMGDAGSMLLGLIISIVPFLGFKKVTLISLAIPMSMMIIPVFEIFATILRRLLKRKSITEADNEHVHYQLLSRTNNPVIAVVIIWVISGVYSVCAIIYEVYGLKMFIIAVTISTCLITLLNILDKKHKIFKTIMTLYKKGGRNNE